MSGPAAAASVGAAAMSVPVTPAPAAADASLVIRRTLIRRIDSMSDSLCQATLQLFIAMVRTQDPAIVDCLLPPTPSTSHFSAAATAGISEAAAPPNADEPFSPSLDSLGPLFEGLTDPRSHADFADTLLDLLTNRHALSTLDAAAPLALSLPPLPTAADPPIAQLRPPIEVCVDSLPAADCLLFASVALNRLDSWLDSSHTATNVLLSTLLAALAFDRRPHVQLLIMGRRTANPAVGGGVVTGAAAGGNGERSVLSSLIRLWRNGRRREHRITQLPQRLAASKAAMGGPLSAARSTAGPSGPAVADSADVQLFLRSWLMLEAVVVELCAIQYSEQTRATSLARLL